MRALVAFDKFKDSLVSERACEIAAEAINAALPGCETDLCPLTDGGEGFARILTRAAGGTISACEVTGPLGATVAASFGIVPLGKIRRGAALRLGLPPTETGGTLAIIEMASASGLALVPRGMRDPMRASSAGTGDLIRAAAAAGARAIL
ncbi:MAG: glycerate kinase, partial [Opitutaceae bacterium]